MIPEFVVDEYIKINKMYSLFEHHFDKGYTFPGETHDFWECVYVKSGSIYVSGNERVYCLNAGEIIFHKPLELHKLFVDDSSGCDVLIFSFSLSGKAAQYFKNKVFKLTDEQREIISRLLNFLHNVFPDYMDNLEEGNYYLKQSTKRPINLHIIATYITHLFLSLYDDHNISSIIDDFSAETFKKAVEFMKENISSQPSVNQIALYCQVNVTTLKKIFTKYGGMGIHKYFLTLKISTAERELKRGKTVTEVANMVGFTSQSYFSAAFKRETGVSPSSHMNKTNRV